MNIVRITQTNSMRYSIFKFELLSRSLSWLMWILFRFSNFNVILWNLLSLFEFHADFFSLFEFHEDIYFASSSFNANVEFFSLNFNAVLCTASVLCDNSLSEQLLYLFGGYDVVTLCVCVICLSHWIIA